MSQPVVRFFLIVVLLSLKPVLSVAQIRAASGKTITVETMDRLLKTVMDTTHMPSLSIAFINDGKIVYHRELGFSNLEKKIRADNNTIYEACSMSKPVFSYFILKMVDRGIIALDTPLYKYYPYPEIAYDGRYKLFTARMVLDHTTGLPNWHEYQPPDSSLHVPKGAQYIMFTPGTRFSYSGEGYQYLVNVIAHLLHTTLTDLCDIVYKEVLAPIKMKNSRFGWSDFIAQHKATGYRQPHDNGINEPGVLKKFEEFSAAGGLHTTAMEYAQFMVALMNGKGLTTTSFEEMMRPQSFPADKPWKDNDGEACGLGIFLKKTPYGIEYQHSGSNGDFTCNFMMFKDSKSGFVFFTNYNRAGDLYDILEPLFIEGDSAKK